MLRTTRATDGASWSAARAALTTAAGIMGLPAAALAQGGAFGPPRKFIWVPQALGDWDLAFQVGARDFCEMVGWEYQRIGNPVYSVQNHAEQVNNAIAAQASDCDLARERRPGAAVRARPGPGHRDDHHGSGHPGGGGRARPAHHQPGRVQCRHPQRHPGRDVRPRPDRQKRRDHRARQRQPGLDLDRQAPERQSARHRAVQCPNGTTTSSRRSRTAASAS